MCIAKGTLRNINAALMAANASVRLVILLIMKEGLKYISYKFIENGMKCAPPGHRLLDLCDSKHSENHVFRWFVPLALLTHPRMYLTL